MPVGIFLFQLMLNSLSAKCRQRATPIAAALARVIYLSLFCLIESFFYQNIQIDGMFNVDASGDGHVKLADFSVRNADITLSGASNGMVNLSGKLDANLSGA